MMLKARADFGMLPHNPLIEGAGLRSIDAGLAAALKKP
jgi:hypothetical protein